MPPLTARLPSPPAPSAAGCQKLQASHPPAVPQTEHAFRALSAPLSTLQHALQRVRQPKRAAPGLSGAGSNGPKLEWILKPPSTLPLKRRLSAANQRTVLSLHAPIPSFPLTSQACSLVLSVVLLPLLPFALSSNLFNLTKHFVSSILHSYNSIDHLTALSPTRIHHDSHRYNTCASQSR